MPRPNTPFRLFGCAPLLLAALVCLLALPGLIGFLHSNARAIQEGENRGMAPRPPFKLWRENAPEFIRAWENRLKDSVGFRLQANALYRKLRHYIFRDPPLINVTIGGKGHVFLNAPQTVPYVFFDALCVQAADPSPELTAELDAVMAAATRFFDRYGGKTLFAFVPGSPALYADRLPLGVPPALRRACLDYPKRDHLIARLTRLGESSGRYRLFYPYDLFNAHKDEKHFWPKERFHWAGRSTYLFARHLLRDSGAAPAAGLDDPAEPGPVPDDIVPFFGFSRPIVGWIYPYADQPARELGVPWITELGRPEMLRHVVTQNSLSDRTALMIANSFGDALRPHLARGFAHLYALDTNFLDRERGATVFAAVAERIRPDYVFFVYDDANVVSLPAFLSGFVELERVENRSGHGGDPAAGSPAPVIPR